MEFYGKVVSAIFRRKLHREMLSMIQQIPKDVLQEYVKQREIKQRESKECDPSTGESKELKSIEQEKVIN